MTKPLTTKQWQKLIVEYEEVFNKIIAGLGPIYGESATSDDLLEFCVACIDNQAYGLQRALHELHDRIAKGEK